jgi:DNA-binding GntR family transcriptional regulator
VLVKSATDDLSFEKASKRVASKLDIAYGDPIAVIRRIARGIDGQALEWRIARGSAARFNYRSEIK